jgi:hypothetical protein
MERKLPAAGVCTGVARALVARAAVWTGFACEAARDGARRGLRALRAGSRGYGSLSGNALAAGALQLAGAAVELSGVALGPAVELGVGAATAGIAAHAVALRASRHGVRTGRTELLGAALRRTRRDHGEALLAADLLDLYCGVALGARETPRRAGAMLARGATALLWSAATTHWRGGLPGVAATLRAARAACDAVRVAEFVSALERHTDALCAVRRPTALLPRHAVTAVVAVGAQPLALAA